MATENYKRKHPKTVIKFELTQAEEEYLAIYHEYFVLRWDWPDICKHHNCSKAKVSEAINWVIANKLKIPSKNLIKGAIDAIDRRLRITKELYDSEVSKTRQRDKLFIISLMREMREDEKTLFRLQEIYHDETPDDSKLSAGQVLSLIKKAADDSKILPDSVV